MCQHQTQCPSADAIDREAARILAAFPEQGSTPATLMRSADRALYVAKGEGRDRWHVPGAPDGAVPGR